MLEFICPTCGIFSLESESCGSCETATTEDLAA